MRATSERADCGLMLGQPRAIARARLLHRTRMVDQDGDVERRFAGCRRLDA